MRQLLPTPVDPVDTMAVYGDLPAVPGRPAVRLNMIASVDGATTLAGVSGGLGGPADHALFAVLRSLADVVLVAAGTVRAERYGPSSTPIAVVSRSLRLDWQAPFFTAPLARPILVTAAQAPRDQLARAAEVADVVVAGDRDVDLAVALAALSERGWRAVLAEGGPNLNGQLARAGLLDELCLTLSPRLAGGDAKRILAGPSLPAATGLRLCSLCEQDGFLFLRYRPQPGDPPRVGVTGG
jgi:riboflavin biosynthesis pyrimidine reductase